MKYYVRFATLPLAVYREVQSHLCQVEGVEVGLVTQQSSQFDYARSQIESLWIQHSDSIAAPEQARVQQILAYYGDRYGPWETVDQF
ncbi:MAG TPA: hypothetical protein V6D18_01310 [Thermosynechococcaceae cyanobacterium]